MDQTANVLEYKCPCCDAGLVFGNETQKMKCPYCDNEFELDTVVTYNDSLKEQNEEDFQWQQQEESQWSDDETKSL